eukprot:403356688
MQYSKVIKITPQDTLIRQILKLEDLNENVFQIQDVNANEELSQQILNSINPETNNQDEQQKPRIKILSLNHAKEMKFPCICAIKQQQIYLENRQASSIVIECEICNNMRNAGYREVHKIFQQNIENIITTKEFDQREFIDAKKSFLQKIIQKEAAPGGHCVLYVANISRSKSLEAQNSFILDLCDGSYIMKCPVSEKIENFDCDRTLIEMINNNILKCGDKFHFYGLYLMNRAIQEQADQEQAIKTEHHYLQSKHKYHLKINLNGLTRALNDQILGEQKHDPFFLRQLQFVKQNSKEVPSIDVIVVKKFQPYFLEEADLSSNNNNQAVNRNGRIKRMIRSRNTMEKIRVFKQQQIQDQHYMQLENIVRSKEYVNMSDSEQRKVQEDLKVQHDEAQRLLLEKFKLCFRIKVVDSITYYYGKCFNAKQTVITFISSNINVYESIEEGHRYRFYNTKPDNMSYNGQRKVDKECLFLKFERRSKRERFEDIIHFQNQALSSDMQIEKQRIKEFAKKCISQNLNPQQLLRSLAKVCDNYDQLRLKNYKYVNELNFVGYLVRTFYRNSTQQDGNDSIESVLLLSSDLDIICLKIHDLNFYIRNSLPHDQSKVICDGVHFQFLSKVQINDSSNTVIKDQQIGELLEDYIKHTKETENQNQFYYLNCQTSNLTSITSDSQMRGKYLIELEKMEKALKSNDFQAKLRQIQMIIGTRESLNHINNHDLPSNTNSNNLALNQFGNSSNSNILIMQNNQNLSTHSPTTTRYSMQIKSSGAVNNSLLALVQPLKKLKATFKGVGGIGGSKLAQSIAKHSGKPIPTQQPKDDSVIEEEGKQNQPADQTESVMSEEDEVQISQVKLSNNNSNTLKLETSRQSQIGFDSDIEEDQHQEEEQQLQQPGEDQFESHIRFQSKKNKNREFNFLKAKRGRKLGSNLAPAATDQIFDFDTGVIVQPQIEQSDGQKLQSLDQYSFNQQQQHQDLDIDLEIQDDENRYSQSSQSQQFSQQFSQSLQFSQNVQNQDKPFDQPSQLQEKQQRNKQVKTGNQNNIKRKHNYKQKSQKAQKGGKMRMKPMKLKVQEAGSSEIFKFPFESQQNPQQLQQNFQANQTSNNVPSQDQIDQEIISIYSESPTKQDILIPKASNSHILDTNSLQNSQQIIHSQQQQLQDLTDENYFTQHQSQQKIQINFGNIKQINQATDQLQNEQNLLKAQSAFDVNLSQDQQDNKIQSQNLDLKSNLDRNDVEQLKSINDDKSIIKF